MSNNEYVEKTFSEKQGYRLNEESYSLQFTTKIIEGKPISINFDHVSKVYALKEDIADTEEECSTHAIYHIYIKIDGEDVPWDNLYEKEIEKLAFVMDCDKEDIVSIYVATVAATRGKITFFRFANSIRYHYDTKFADPGLLLDKGFLESELYYFLDARKTRMEKKMNAGLGLYFK